MWTLMLSLLIFIEFVVYQGSSLFVCVDVFDLLAVLTGHCEW